MQIVTLGPLAVDGRPVRGERLAAVVRALVAARGRAVSTSVLVSEVWDGAPPDDAPGAVQALVARVRRLGLPVVAVPGGYRVPADQVSVDAVEARSLVERARAALLAGDPAAARRCGDAARAHFPEVPELGGTEETRLLADVAAVRAQAALAGAGPFDEADLRRLAGHTPPDEPSAALLVRVLAAQGRDAEALEFVERLRGELADRYGTDLSPVVTQAHLALLRGELSPAVPHPAGHATPATAIARAASAPAQVPTPAPAAPTPAPAAPASAPPVSAGAGSAAVSPAGAVPGAVRSPAVLAMPAAWRRPGTAFVGRDRDVAVVAAALDDAPLVTVVATGGAGKTRLAAEVAVRAAASGRSVRVVELAGLRSPDEVLPAVLAAVGGTDPATGLPEFGADRSGVDRLRAAASGERSRTPTAGERLRAAARDLDGLLVLDNCEHLLAAAAAVVAELLAEAPPGLAVLATSRAPLSLLGEVVHRLRALPDDDALGLLGARVRAGGGAPLAWDPGRALELCHRLDNLPLALVLAAARLRHMPIDDVLAGLADRFALLDDALRGLPERHASLWAMVDWSRELLSPDDRELLRRLAVIPAPFTADAAAAVAGAGAVAGPVDAGAAVVRRGLATLVEQSLLVLDEGDDGVPRYRMLETVREYGDVRLDADAAAPGGGGRAAAMAGLVRWARARAVAFGAGFVGDGQIAALAGCGVEQENLLAALRWAMAHGDEPAVADIAVALLHLWTVRGMHLEVAEFGRLLLHIDDPAARRCSVIAQGGVDRPGAGRELPDADRLAWLYVFVGLSGGVTDSHRIFVAARRCLRRLSLRRPAEISRRATAIGQVLNAAATLDHDVSTRAATAMIAEPDRYVQAFGLLLRAQVHENRGRLAESSADAEEAYRCFESIGDHWGMGMAAQGLGEWAVARGQDRANEWLRRSEQHLQLIGAEQDAGTIRVLLDIQLALGGDADAAERLRRSAAGPPGQGPVHATLGLAQCAYQQGRHDEALAHARTVVDLVEVARFPSPQIRTFFRIATAILMLHVTAGRADPGADRGADRGAAPVVGDVIDPHAVGMLVQARDALSSLDIPVLGSWALGGAALAAHLDRPGDARELWVLGVRLGANVVHMFRLGYGERLAAALGDEASREPLLAAWQGRSVGEATARIRELMDDLLG